MFLVKACSRVFFSKKTTSQWTKLQNPVQLITRFTLISNSYDIGRITYASSHSPMYYSVVRRLTLIHSVVFFHVCLVYSKCFVSACRNKTMFFTMCWIVDEHLEDIKVFTTVNSELVCIKCFGILAWSKNCVSVCKPYRNISNAKENLFGILAPS